MKAMDRDDPVAPRDPRDPSAQRAAVAGFVASGGRIQRIPRGIGGGRREGPVPMPKVCQWRKCHGCGHAWRSCSRPAVLPRVRQGATAILAVSEADMRPGSADNGPASVIIRRHKTEG